MHHLKYDEYFGQYIGCSWVGWISCLFLLEPLLHKHKQHPNTTNDTTNAITLAATSLAQRGIHDKNPNFGHIDVSTSFDLKFTFKSESQNIDSAFPAVLQLKKISQLKF